MSEEGRELLGALEYSGWEKDLLEAQILKNEKISVVSGGFDPIHSGHIEYIKSAKNLGEKLIVALNSNEWLLRKKVTFFYHLKKENYIGVIKIC